MRIQKIVRGTITAAAAFAISLAPVIAADVNSTTLINSGDKVHVDTSTENNSSVAVSNSNSAHVDQSVTAKAVTGGNSASENITLGGAGTTINTGAAGVNTVLGVTANKNETAVAGTSAGSANLTDVVNTGDKVNVETETENNTAVSVSNRNFADVSQSAYEKAISGQNDADRNIGSGVGINTGPAGVGTNMDVTVNKNLTGVGGWSGVGTLTNGGLVNDTSLTNTGDFVNVDTDAESNSAVTVRNYNALWSSQDVFAKAISGRNSASENIGSAGINTGPAGVSTGLGVTANKNVTGVGGGYGGPGYSLNTGEFINTGDFLFIETEVEDNSATSIWSKNKLFADQYAYEKSISGYNAADDNIGGSGIGTSVAGVNTGFGLLANSNSNFVGNWFGTWLGWLSL